MNDLEATDNGAELRMTFSIAHLAAIFCDWDDDTQARFFVEVARIMAAWGPGKMDSQGWYVGGHLRNCSCSTEEARDLIRSIVAGLERSNHGAEVSGISPRSEEK